MRVLALVVALAAVESFAQVPFVYSRCPRTSTPVNGTPNQDLVEMLPDTQRALDGFVAPCDLVYNDGAGQERVLYDCISRATDQNACAALDAAVSFDGRTIAFAVFRGSLARFWADGRYYTGKYLDSREAQLFLVDVATGRLTPLPHTSGHFDFGPAFLPNGRLAFTGTRLGTTQTAVSCRNTNPLAPQTFTMDVDGRNVELASPHALGAELHPYPLVDGRLAYSSWQLFGALPFRKPNSPGGCGTLHNMFHLYVQNPDGANAMALYGQHVSEPTLGNGSEYDVDKFSTHMAAHFLTQTSDGRVWTGEYYRNNNLGLGSIVGFPVPPPGQEGWGYEATALKKTVFRVKSQVRLAAWSSQSDQEASVMPAPAMRVPGYADPIRKAGKIGHPAALPGNGLMLTWGIGDCTTVTGKLAHVAMADYAAAYGDNPYCDTGIYRLPGPVPPGNLPLTHPNQLVPLVNRKEFHEFMARAVVPYQQLMGVPAPARLPGVDEVPASDPFLPHGTPFGLLGASSLIHRETRPAFGFPHNEGTGNFTLQGADTGQYADSELCGVRILAVQPTRPDEHRKRSVAPLGERVMILGEFPVRKTLPDGGSPRDGLGHPDTSFRVRFPAEFPYLMQAIDCQGLTLNTDQVWQHLRAGETKTCNGCHVHSDQADRLPFSTTVAGRSPLEVHRLGEGQVPLLRNGVPQTVASFGLRLEFVRDVWPIFQSRCVSCHGATNPGGGLRLDLPRAPTANGEYPADLSTYRCLANDSDQDCVVAPGVRAPTNGASALKKPWLSKWVHMLSARQSLLYWKAANRRADGFTDSSASDDIDFGAAHPTGITPDELATLGRWIDTGAGWGLDFDQDTIRPSLHVVGVQDGGITALRIGTADVGDGVAPTSLTVCLRAAPDAGCQVVTSPPAAPAGVVEAPLPAVQRNPDVEVEVSVRDRAGNVTTHRKTIGALLGLPPPVPTDAGVPMGGGSAGGGVVGGGVAGGASTGGGAGGAGAAGGSPNAGGESGGGEAGGATSGGAATVGGGSAAGGEAGPVAGAGAPVGGVVGGCGCSTGDGWPMALVLVAVASRRRSFRNPS